MIKISEDPFAKCVYGIFSYGFQNPKGGSKSVDERKD